MIRTLLVSLTLFLSLAALAKKSGSPPPLPATPALSLREQALTETKVDGQKVKYSTDAQVSGMLTLKDPKPEILGRNWIYFAGLFAQNFQAEGTASKPGSGVFNLGGNDSTTMPGFALGFLSSPLETGPVSWKLGLRARAGFASQGTDVTLPSGYRIEDARLNSTLFSGGPLVHLQWERFPRIALTGSAEAGTLSYSQTSSNSFAAFSKQAGFKSWGLGTDIRVGKQWSLFSEYTQRTLNETNDIALQKDNYELGTKVTW